MNVSSKLRDIVVMI